MQPEKWTWWSQGGGGGRIAIPCSWQSKLDWPALCQHKPQLRHDRGGREGNPPRVFESLPCELWRPHSAFHWLLRPQTNPQAFFIGQHCNQRHLLSTAIFWQLVIYCLCCHVSRKPHLQRSVTMCRNKILIFIKPIMELTLLTVCEHVRHHLHGHKYCTYAVKNSTYFATFMRVYIIPKLKTVKLTSNPVSKYTKTKSNKCEEYKVKICPLRPRSPSFPQMDVRHIGFIYLFVLLLFLWMSDIDVCDSRFRVVFLEVWSVTWNISVFGPTKWVQLCPHITFHFLILPITLKFTPNCWRREPAASTCFHAD